MPLITPEEFLKHPAPPRPLWVREPWRYGVKVDTGSLIPNDEYQIQFLKPPTKSGKPGEPFWFSNPGPQGWSLVAPFDEMMIGGSRGGSKSAALIAWLAMGDPTLSPQDPARYSFLLEPSYRAVILRKEHSAMAEFIGECADFFGPLGGKPKNDPTEFHFKSGAIIYTKHLGDKGAFESLRGWGISRIGIEELTQIEDENSYLKLFGSLRGKKQIRIHGKYTFPALHSQIMSTSNPDGEGKAWVKKRFVKVLNKNGEQIPWNTPMRDPISGLTRIFIPMSRKDNPYLRDNKQYEGMLLMQDEVTRKAWIEGSWDFGAGTFFTEWRPKGPVTSEEIEKYPWARHVIESEVLQPWWHRWGGGDFGYDHPASFHKFCKSEKDGRIHCYDEMNLRHCGSFEVGARLANWWLPDLEQLPDKTVTIAFSSDAFSKTDDTKTKAEQIAAGINSILGPYGAFLMKYTDDERKAMASDPDVARRMFERRRTEASAGAQGKLCIILKPASKDVEARWSYMRDLLRFRPIVQETEAQLKERLMATFNRGGVDAYERELSKVKRPDDENLPKLQVWKRCSGLIRCMEEANQDPDRPGKIVKWNAVEGVGGDDSIESAGHGLHYFKDVEKAMPRSYYLSERMEHIQMKYEQELGERITDPTRLMMVHTTQASRFDAANPSAGKSFSMPRASSSRHRGRVN